MPEKTKKGRRSVPCRGNSTQKGLETRGGGLGKLRLCLPHGSGEGSVGPGRNEAGKVSRGMIMENLLC